MLREGGGRARGQHSFVGQQGQQETLATLSARRVLLLARLACLLWHSMRGADCNKQHQLVGWNDRTALCLLSITHFPAVWKLSTRTKHALGSYYNKHALGSVCRCTLARVHHGVVTHVLPARHRKLISHHIPSQHPNISCLDSQEGHRACNSQQTDLNHICCSPLQHVYLAGLAARQYNVSGCSSGWAHHSWRGRQPHWAACS